GHGQDRRGRDTAHGQPPRARARTAVRAAREELPGAAGRAGAQRARARRRAAHSGGAHAHLGRLRAHLHRGRGDAPGLSPVGRLGRLRPRLTPGGGDMGEGDAERPRERLARGGPESLALSELLALVLRTGARGAGALRLAETLVERFGSLDALARAGTAE